LSKDSFPASTPIKPPTNLNCDNCQHTGINITNTSNDNHTPYYTLIATTNTFAKTNIIHQNFNSDNKANMINSATTPKLGTPDKGTEK